MNPPSHPWHWRNRCRPGPWTRRTSGPTGGGWCSPCSSRPRRAPRSIPSWIRREPCTIRGPLEPNSSKWGPRGLWERRGNSPPRRRWCWTADGTASGRAALWDSPTWRGSGRSAVGTRQCRDTTSPDWSSCGQGARWRRPVPESCRSSRPRRPPSRRVCSPQCSKRCGHYPAAAGLQRKTHRSISTYSYLPVIKVPRETSEWLGLLLCITMIQ